MYFPFLLNENELSLEIKLIEYYSSPVLKFQKLNHPSEDKLPIFLLSGLNLTQITLA